MYFQVSFTPIDFPGSIDNTTFAVEINNRADIVGEYDLTVEITDDFIYKNGEYRTLDTPFGRQVEARDINDAGVFVGNAYDDPYEGPVHGFSLERYLYTV